MSQVQDNAVNNEVDEFQAKTIAKALDVNSDRLSMLTLKRLEDARALAVSVHAGKISGQKVNADGTISSLSVLMSYPHILRVGLLCAALILGLGITYHNMNKQLESSDAFLLGAELPPEAFVDRGFEPWLNAKAEL